MAEQEACTELVKQASQDQSSQSIDGESLLLPLLQGLLDAPENEQTQDSGTESGEDQRSGLIAEVQNALEKLSTSLQSDATDITPERRSSLLQLVTKLQAGLSSATSDRRHSAQMRFNRRRERPDRHTIGVSNEELADARRLMQEISCPSQSSSRTSLIPKQNSESSVDRTATSYNPVNQKSSVKNSTPKPFSSSNSANASTNSSSVQTPSESMDFVGYLFNEEKKEQHSSDTSPTPIENQTNVMQSPYKSSQFSHNSSKSTELQRNNHPKNNLEDSEDESSTMKMENKPDILMQHNPIYYQPKEDELDNSRKNRFTSKKLKMRRANTIDIPKPLHFYEYDDEEETDAEDEERKRRSNYLALRGPIRVGNSANRNSVPLLEPKTENDKKFLEFISKHNQKNQRHSLWANKTDHSPIWNNKFDHIKTNFEKAPNAERIFPRSRNFAKCSDDSGEFEAKRYDPKISKQSAMNLKKMFEEKQRSSNERRNSITTENSFRFMPTVPEKNVRFIPQPLPVNKFSHAPSSAFQPVSRNINENSQQSPFRPISDKDAHEGKSEKLSEITKSVLEVNDTQGPNRLFLYSPKPVKNRENSSPTSPGFAKPWVGNTGESRVLALAAKRFENPAPSFSTAFQPRRLSREKINAIPNFQNTSEKLTAPYLMKTLEQANTVRKLSGQYDNLGFQCNKSDKFPQHHGHSSRRTHIEGFQPKFTVPQNYSIRYDRPNLPPQKNPEIYNATPTEVKKYNKSLKSEKQDNSNYYSPRHDYNFCKLPEQSSTESENHHQTFSHTSDHLQEKFPVGQHQNKQNNKAYRESNDDENNWKPKSNTNYQIQTRVKTEVYEKPRIEINEAQDREKTNSRPNYLSQSSVESIKEYEGINSRVMSGPVAQVASMVKQKSPMSRNEHDMQAAFSLKTTLQKVSNSPSPNPRPMENTEIFEEPKKQYQERGLNTGKPQGSSIITNNTPSKIFNDMKSEEKSRIYNRSTVSESHEMTARGEHVVTGKLPLPPSINVQSSYRKPTQAQVLSKSDSWHQICLLNQANPQQKPASRTSNTTRNIMKSKSTHSMIPPKQFEAGMTKDEIAEKKRTMEAFLGSGSSSHPQPKSPSPGKVVKRAINRTKTSEKNVQYKHIQSPEMPTGLSRSRTLPDIVCVDLLDESNVDKAFEDLFTSS